VFSSASEFHVPLDAARVDSPRHVILASGPSLRRAENGTPQEESWWLKRTGRPPGQCSPRHKGRACLRVSFRDAFWLDRRDLCIPRAEAIQLFDEQTGQPCHEREHSCRMNPSLCFVRGISAPQKVTESLMGINKRLAWQSFTRFQQWRSCLHAASW